MFSNRVNGKSQLDKVKASFERMRKVIKLQRADRLPVSVLEYAYIEYRSDVYHLGEVEGDVPAGEVVDSVDGKKKYTSDGGVWGIGDKEVYEDYNDVLRVDVAGIEVETVGPVMLDEMQRMYAEVAQSSFPIPWHYGTLVTRATIEFDWEPFLMAAALEPVKFGKILDRFGSATLSVIKGWVKLEDAELIVIHDDIASTKGVILSPAWYREYVFPWYKQFFDVVHQGGKKVLYISDGNYIDVLDDLLETEPDGLYIESTSLDPETLMRAAGKDKLYMLKFDARSMDFGTPEDVYAELKKIRKLHEEFPGIMISPGGGTMKPENAQAFWQYYDELLVYEK